EVAEVVVRRVLAAEDRVLRRHLRLDEGVPHARPDGPCAGGTQQVGHGARGDEVVDDGRLAARGLLLLDLPEPDEPGDGAGADRDTTLVDDEAPVRVAVEGEADVGAGGDDST